jgi:hypothetical protein
LGFEEQGFVSNVYGPQTPEVKRYFVRAISQLGHLMQDQQWIFGGGEFNLITSLEEKKGGVHKMDVENNLFKEIIYSYRSSNPV